MLSSWNKHKYDIQSVLYALCSLSIIAAMLIWPQETFQGALYGLELWATILVPSLLPFFIIAEILIYLGIVQMLGVLLEPLMRPLFNLPGTASFVVAMGFTSGFPMGAVLTRRLCEEKLCSISEAERLVAFTNNSSPLFILAAVAVGMYGNPLLGVILAVAHYSSNIIIGILLALFSLDRKNHCIPLCKENLLVKSILTLIAAQKNRKPLGKLLGDSIKAGITNITLIGGFVVIFAVLIRLLTAAGIIGRIMSLCATLIKAFGYSPALGSGFTVGFWEMTLGLRELSFPVLSLTERAVAASIILGWSGLSIQAQVTSVLSGSGIRPHLYYLGRFLQGALGGFIAFALSHTTGIWADFISLPTFSFPPFDNPFALLTINLRDYIPFVFKSSFLLFAIMLTLSYVIYTFHFIYRKI